jgi:phage tail sheath protein FI
MDIEETNNAGVVLTGSGVVSVKKTVDNFKNRGLDSSFAAAYFPDVTKTVLTTTIGRSNSVEENLITVPPSVVALGAFSYNDAVAHPWFAPAGFTRGALEAVESATIRFNRNNLDDVYDADINPLTAFPGTGVVIWGQKTLLQNSSALDRVNVRRLLIDIRRSVRNVANTLLFEPNRQETLDRFNSLVNPILQRVQEQGGVDRYKVIIDTTTTTQADVENNTIRGKIFLQPTRAVEFVALDFVVTNAGAEGL